MGGSAAPPPSPVPETRPTLPRSVLAELERGTDWLGTWWPMVVLLVLLTAAVLFWVVRRRRGRRAWPAMLVAFTLLVCAGAAGLNAWVGYVPSVDAAFLLVTGEADGVVGDHGTVSAEKVPVPADLAVPASTTWVYTPPGYDSKADTRYPVVYLIHGTPGMSSDWVTAGGIAHVMDVLISHRLIQPMIVVAPDVNGKGISDTECLDSTRGGPQIETYLNKVVVPWVDAHYRTAADWQHRVIGGMSSGGYCALDQGLRHPELYGAIIALEPYDNPGTGGRAMLATQAEFDAHSLRKYLPSMTFEHPVPVFLDAGEASRGDSEEIRWIAGALAERKQPLLFRVEPGQSHTWTMARTAIPYGLVFVSQHIPRP